MVFKKMDTNNAGLFSIAQLTSRQSQRFQKLDRNNDGHIDKTDFNTRLVVICKLIDSNRYNMLDGENISYADKLFS